MTESIGAKVKLEAKTYEGYTPVAKTKTITVEESQGDVEMSYKKDVDPGGEGQRWFICLT